MKRQTKQPLFRWVLASGFIGLTSATGTMANAQTVVGQQSPRQRLPIPTATDERAPGTEELIIDNSDDLGTPVTFPNPFLGTASVFSPGTGFLSLGIYNLEGTLIRTLSYAKPVVKGTISFPWDANTDLGLIAAPGQYRVKGVWFPTLPSASYVMKVGVGDPAGAINPPYPTPDGLGSWGGNLGPPTSVCSNGSQLVSVFGCVESPWETGIQLMDAKGKILRRFYSFFPWDIRLASVMDANNLYMAVADLSNKRLSIGKYSLNNSRGTLLTTLPTGQHTTPTGRWQGRWTTEVRGLAIMGGRVYAPVTMDDTLFIVDAGSGKTLFRVNITSPRGVVSSGNNLYVLSGDKLVQLDPDGNFVRTVIASGLDDPSGLAMDAAGNFLISDCGLSQQVKLFSPQGTLVQTIGVAGGRPTDGVFNPAGMREPRSITLGPDGCLWVAECEECFQRVSVWDMKTGGLKREFFNTRISAGQGQLSPDRTEMLFTYNLLSDAPGISAYKVDIAKGTWYPSWSVNQTLERGAQENVLIGYSHPGHPIAGYSDHWSYLDVAGKTVQATNGKTYIASPEGAIWLYDPTTKQIKLAALVPPRRAWKQSDGRYKLAYDQGRNTWLTWSDLNGDGQLQPQEVNLSGLINPLDKALRISDWQLQPDLSLIGLPVAYVGGTAAIKLAPRRVLESGVPVYDWSDVQTVTVDFVMGGVGASLLGGDQNPLKQIRYSYLSGATVANNSVYTTVQPASAGQLTLPGKDGQGWWASRNWRTTPMKFDLTTGKSGWLKLGRRAPGQAKPGEMYSVPWSIAGVAQNCLFVPDTLGQVWAWTDTGLYLGGLYNDPPGMNQDSLLVEETGAFTYDIGGNVYTCAGDHGVSVHQVNLPKRTAIRGRTLTLTPAQAATAKLWDPDGSDPTVHPTYSAKLSPVVPTLDNNLNDWYGTKYGHPEASPIMLGDQCIAYLFVVYDKNNLNLMYNVVKGGKAVNSGSELPLAPFTSGSYVDFMIGANWSNPNRTGTLAGDIRGIVAPVSTAALANYQMGFSPVKPGGGNPFDIVSPAARTHFDDISPIAGLKFAYRVYDSGHYSVQIQVPLSSLGLTSPAGKTIGFDASVAIASADGNFRQSAGHWAGQSEASVVDRPGAAALLPSTWGTLVFLP